MCLKSWLLFRGIMRGRRRGLAGHHRAQQRQMESSSSAEEYLTQLKTTSGSWIRVRELRITRLSQASLSQAKPQYNAASHHSKAQGTRKPRLAWK